MKAWIVRDNNGDCGCTVIFAETRGKAIGYALGWCQQFEGLEWTEMNARRFKKFDTYYKGESEIDWSDSYYQIPLVRDFGWHCEEASWDCKECEARQWCSLLAEDE